MRRARPDRPTGDLTEAWGRFDPDRPLMPDSPWWVDCHEARGGPDLVKRVVRRIGAASKTAQFVHDLFTGHRGCGKSTELNRVADALKKEGFFVICFSVLDLVDPLNVEFGDVLVAVARQVTEKLSREEIGLGDKLLGDIYDWFADRVESEVGIKKSELDVAAGAELQGLPMLVKLFARLNSAFHMGEEKRSELRRVVREHLGVLIDRVNELFRNARARLRKRGFRDLVIIVDNLDRVDTAPREALGGRSQHDVILCDHGPQLTSLQCHTIYTVSIGLVLAAQSAQLSAIYGETYHLPMIKVRTREGAPSELGCRTLANIVARRAAVELFDGVALDRMCAHSGGNPRDLVRLVRRAIEHTDEAPIAMAAAAAACQELTNEFRWLNDEQLRLLLDLHRRPERTLSMSDQEKLLLSSRAILGYGDGVEWYDVHPAITQLDRFKALAEAGDV